MPAKIHSCTIIGVDAVPIDVEVDVVSGDPSYEVIGLASRWEKQGHERMRAALASIGEEMPLARIVARLEPRDLREHGFGFDLPILLALLSAASRMSLDAMDGLLVLGELGLDGRLRAVKGTLPAARLARAQGWRGILVPRANAHEAVVIDGIEVYCADHLSEVLNALKQGQPLPSPDPHPLPPPPPREYPSSIGFPWDMDMSDVPGHARAHAALEIAAAGGHSVLMVGGPGTAQERLASRLPTISPPMTHDEFVETMNVFSAIGQAPHGFAMVRPLRCPHFSIPPSTLLGGGTPPGPGEVSLANNGTLFLKDLHEFSRSTLESLVKVLQQRTITISEKNHIVSMPASFLMVATVNPCPCGWLDSGRRECTCSSGLLQRYWAKMSSPLLDRFDLWVQSDHTENRSTVIAERSEVVRARVSNARARQQKRLESWGMRTNAEMSMEAIASTCGLDGGGEAALAELSASGRVLTPHITARILRVARTIADLKDQDAVDAECLLDASTYRAMEKDAILRPPIRTPSAPAVHWIERS